MYYLALGYFTYQFILLYIFYQDAAVLLLGPLVQLIVLCHSLLLWKDQTSEI